MGEVTKKYHYIPEFYLAGFTMSGTKKNSIYVFDQKIGEQRPSKPKEEGYHKHFYKTNVEGFKSDFIEKVLGKIETMTAPIIKEISNTNILSKGKKFNILMNFLALMSSRIPSKINRNKNFIERISKDYLKIVANHPDYYHEQIKYLTEKEGIEIPEVSFDKFREHIQNDSVPIEIKQDYLLHLMFDEMDTILPYLFTRNWSLILIKNHNQYFVCSDNPIALYFADPSIPPTRSPGYAHLNTEVTFPLNKDMSICGRFEPIPKIIEADKRLVATINSRTAKGSERFLYSCEENFIYLMKDNEIGETKDLIEKILKSIKLKDK